MSNAQNIRDHLAKHPGAGSTDVAAAVGLSVTRVAGQLKPMLDTGVVTRVQAGTTLTGTPKYAYTLTGKAGGRPGIKKGTKLSPKKPVDKGIDNGHSTIPAPPGDFLSPLIESMAEGLVAQLMRRVKELLPAALTAAVDAGTQARLAFTPVQASPPPEGHRARKPRVLLVGLLPAQAGAVTSTCGEAVDVLYWKDGSTARLREFATSADHVFLHTRHMSHAQQEMVQSCRPHNQITRVGGGVKAMHDAIANWINANIGKENE